MCVCNFELKLQMSFSRNVVSYRVSFVMIIVAICFEMMKMDPVLIECFCDATYMNRTMTSESESIYLEPIVANCMYDAFATAGIRWYINGSLDSTKSYWSGSPTGYSNGRAAQRFILLGYRCISIPLYDGHESLYN